MSQQTEILICNARNCTENACQSKLETYIEVPRTNELNEDLKTALHVIVLSRRRYFENGLASKSDHIHCYVSNWRLYSMMSYCIILPFSKFGELKKKGSEVVDRYGTCVRKLMHVYVCTTVLRMFCVIVARAPLHGSTRVYVHVHVYTGQSVKAIDKPLKIINNPRALLSATLSNCRTVAHDKDPWSQYPEPKVSVIPYLASISSLFSGLNVAGKIAFANIGALRIATRTV